MSSDNCRTINNSATYYVVTRGRQGNSQFEHHFRADTVRLVSSRNESEMSVMQYKKPKLDVSLGPADI